jgi:hypothetical protein
MGLIGFMEVMERVRPAVGFSPNYWLAAAHNYYGCESDSPHKLAISLLFSSPHLRNKLTTLIEHILKNKNEKS